MTDSRKLRNFIPINRDFFEHKLWKEKRVFSKAEAWLYIIKETRFEDSEVLDGNVTVSVKRGQLYNSFRFYAEAWGWSTKKVGNFLNFLEKEEMIKKETLKETNQTLITVCNYDTYNGYKTDTETREETLRKQQGNAKETKSNKENKDKNEKNNKIKIGNEEFFVKSQFIEFLNEMQEDLIWLEPICMNKRISVDEMIIWLKKFFIELTNDNDETERDLSDYKKYFNRWLTSKLDKQEKENSQNKQEPKDDEKLCRWEIPQLGDQRKGTYKQYMIDKNRNSNLEINFLGFLN